MDSQSPTAKSDTHAAILGMTRTVASMASRRGGGGGRMRIAGAGSDGSRKRSLMHHSATSLGGVPNSDLFQDAMVKMLTVAGQHTGENGAKLETYLHTVARHEVLKSAIQNSRPCWAPKSPQHVALMPKHHVVEFSTQGTHVCPEDELERALIKDGIDACIAASAYPEAVRSVLIEDTSVRWSAGHHKVPHAKLQAEVSRTKEAIRNSAALRDLARSNDYSDRSDEEAEVSLRTGVVKMGAERIVPFYHRGAAVAAATALTLRSGVEHTVCKLDERFDGMVVRCSASGVCTDAVGTTALRLEIAGVSP